jgi:hypothetical protein
MYTLSYSIEYVMAFGLCVTFFLFLACGDSDLINEHTLISDLINFKP